MCVLDKNASSRDFLASHARGSSVLKSQSLEIPCPPAGDMDYLSDHSSKRSDDMSPPRLKFLCSYGGKILPRPCDFQLRYTGGEARVFVVNRGTSFMEFIRRLGMIAKMDVCVKYKLPHEDLDALVSVLSEEDFQNMLDEYDKVDLWNCSCKLRLFLFPQNHQARCNINQVIADASNSKQQFIEGVSDSLSITRKPKDYLPIPTTQQLPQLLGGLQATSDSPLRFSTSASYLLAVPPASSHVSTKNFTPVVNQTRPLSIPMHRPVRSSVFMKPAGHRCGDSVSGILKMQNPKGGMQQSQRDKPQGSHFQSFLRPAYSRAAPAPSNQLLDIVNTETSALGLEPIAHGRHSQAMSDESQSPNGRSSSYRKSGMDFLDVENLEAQDRRKLVINGNGRHVFQPHKPSKMVKDHTEADWQVHYKLDKSSSGSSSNSSYDCLHEMRDSTTSTGMSSPSPRPLQRRWKISPSTNPYDGQLHTSDEAYEDQPSRIKFPDVLYYSNVQATTLTGFPAQTDAQSMRQLQQQGLFSAKLPGKDKITKSRYFTHAGEAESLSNSPRYGWISASADYPYEPHQNVFPAPHMHGFKQQHVLYS